MPNQARHIARARLTSKDIIVTSQIFGGRVNDNICAKLDGSLVDGSSKGAVNADNSAVGVTELGDESNVHAAQVGVGRTL